MLIPTILFYLFAAVLVFSAFMVISSKNPVHAVLFLILAFFNASGLFILLGAELVAMLLVIVYVGAVAVLFLFVVMMLDINFAKMRQGFLRYLPIGALVATLLFVEFFLVLKTSSISLTTPGTIAETQMPIPQGITNARAIGNVLYTHYVFAFQLSGLTLLVAMIGAIVLTLRKRENVKRQNIGKQIGRRREKSVKIVKVKPGKGI